MKVVINKGDTMFSITYEAIMLYAKLKGITLYIFDMDTEERLDKPTENGFDMFYSTDPDKVTNASCFDITGFDRDDPVLVKVIEKL